MTILDDNSQSVLHKASQQGYALVVAQPLRRQNLVDVGDKRGWTALHFASFINRENVKVNTWEYFETDKLLTISHYEVVRLLLETGASPSARTQDKETALHLAVSRNHIRRVHILLEYMNEEDIAIQDKNGKTALSRAAVSRDSAIIRLLLAKVERVDFGARNIEEERQTMMWAAEKEETHDIVLSLAQKRKIKTGDEIPEEWEQYILLWAAYNEDYELVWRLLYSSKPSLETDRKRKFVEIMVQNLVTRSSRNVTKTIDEGGHLRQKSPNIQIGKDGKKGQPQEGNESQNKKSNYDLILDLLRDPPIFQTSIAREPYKKPTLEADIDIRNFEATLVDFYAHDNRSGFLRRFRKVEDVIYGSGPKTIMEQAQSLMENSSTTYGGPGHDKSYSKSDFQFRWIHLPANNIQWMNDLILRISIDEGQSEENFNSLSEFFRYSLNEQPDGSSKSRFMKPGCLKQENGKHELAIYMPYLTFSTHNPEKVLNSEYDKLLEYYKDRVIHGSRTLDEFYYHFPSDKTYESDMKRRNEDQVVTREINGDEDRTNSWTILRVDQLWLWVIDSHTIITSSTHRTDGEGDPVHDSVFQNLTNKPRDKPRARNTHSQPSTSREMSQFIVDTCIDFYNQDKLHWSSESERFDIQASVRQLFSNSINRSAMEETKLFEQYMNNNSLKNGNSEMNIISENLKLEDRGKTAKLLSNVKDIRDELNILMKIVSYQNDVQKSLFNKTKSTTQIIGEIEEMNKMTERIYKAVSTTLNLEQNEISIKQSIETVRQGKTLTVFTIITIIFLPMSFLASLFAVNVTVFQHDASDNLKYSPEWIFPIIFGVSAGISVPLIMYAFWNQSPQYIRNLVSNFMTQKTLMIYSSGDYRDRAVKIHEDQYKDKSRWRAITTSWKSTRQIGTRRQNVPRDVEAIPP